MLYIYINDAVQMLVWLKMHGAMMVEVLLGLGCVSMGHRFV